MEKRRLVEHISLPLSAKIFDAFNSEDALKLYADYKLSPEDITKLHKIALEKCLLIVNFRLGMDE